MGDFAGTYMLGHLTRNPGHRREGQDPVNFAIAINRRGGERDQVSFFECEAWSKLGEQIHRFARKGSLVFIVAEPYQSTWTSKEGAKRSEVRFRVVRCEFLSKLAGGDGGDAPQGAGPDTSFDPTQFGGSADDYLAGFLK